MNTTHTPELDLMHAVTAAMPDGYRLGEHDTAASTVYLHENNRPHRLVTVFLLTSAPGTDHHRSAEIFVVNDHEHHHVHYPERVEYTDLADLAADVVDVLTRHESEDR